MLDTDLHKDCLDTNGLHDPMLSATLDFVKLCNTYEWKKAWEYMDNTALAGELDSSYTVETLRHEWTTGSHRCEGYCGWFAEEVSSTTMRYYFHCANMKSNALQVRPPQSGTHEARCPPVL